MAENVSFDFASRDYATIRKDLLTRASRTIPEWTDRDPSDFGMALVDLWAYMGDIMHYYIDRAGAEAFLTTATQRESVLALANLFDYTPRFRTQASGTVYLSNDNSASVQIPQYTKFTGVYNNTLYTFYNNTATNLPAATTAGVTLVEGSIVEYEVVSRSATGRVGQRYALQETNVVPTSVRVFVYEDGVTETEWSITSNVNTLPVGAAGFSVYTSPTGETEIVFGNRVNGRIPPVGAVIKATYVTCNGTSGNVPENTVRSFFQTPTTGVSIGTSTAFTGGSDIESIDSIKRSIKATVRNQERAVTLQDFADYAMTTSGVYRSMAAFNAGTSTVTLYSIPYISSYTSYTGYSASVPASVQTEILDKVEPYALLGVTVQNAASVTINRVDVTGVIYVKDKYVASAVKAAVETALSSLFDINNVDFGKEIPIGEVYRTAMNVAGVDYLTLSTYEMRSSSNTLVSTGTLDPTHILKKGTFTFTTSGGVTTSV